MQPRIFSPFDEKSVVRIYTMPDTGPANHDHRWPAINARTIRGGTRGMKQRAATSLWRSMVWSFYAGAICRFTAIG
jgi:hypothetical protein